MNNLDILKARLNALGGTADSRIEREKLKSLNGALKYSYQSERIILNGEEHRALINNNKLKMDYDDKIISIPHSSQIKVGDLFYWSRTNSDWLVYLQQLSEDAYFRGFVRKAQHTIKWKDEFGNICETKGAVRGPVETKIRHQMRKGLSFDEPNYTLSILVPSNEETLQLKRYTKLMIAEKPWEIVATDPLSEPGVIEWQLSEYYFNREEDTKEVAGGQIETKITVVSCLDDLSEVIIGQAIELWTDVMVDGKISSDLGENVKYEVLEGYANIQGKLLTLTNNTNVKISLSIPKVNFRKEFTLKGVEEVQTQITDVDIIGNEVVKSFGKSEYNIVKYSNGVRVAPKGMWLVEPNPALFTIAEKNSEKIVLTWKSGKTGKVILKYNDYDKEVTKEIKVESLL